MRCPNKSDAPHEKVPQDTLVGLFLLFDILHGMIPETLICDTTNITYSKGYIALWLKDYSLPDTIEVEGETQLKKDHFHVSLLCVKNLEERRPGIETEVLKHFCDFIKRYPIEFSNYTGEFRLANREERKSVVAMCTITNLDKFADYLSEKIGLEVPHQPAHVTLYTRGQNLGIGLNCKEELAKLTTPFSLAEVLVMELKY
jgi:hypothetical protein